MSTPSLSDRAQARLDHEIYRPRHFITRQLYDKEKCPEGVINLATAENLLMSEELLKYMNSHFTMTPSHLKYRASLEASQVPNTTQALPRFINASLKPRQPVTVEHAVLGPGLGALIAQFMWSVCDEGDGVLMTTPYYDDLARDISYPARAQIIPAYVPKEEDSLQPEALKYAEDAIEDCKAKGIKIRVLFFCNPQNPLARAYPKESILAYARFAEKHDLHLLCDEVYSNQVFASKYDPNPQPFISILSLDIQDCNPSRIHVLSGPTKDFGASGVKLGAFISQHNPALVTLMKASLGPIPISSAADALFTPILNDEKFFSWFLEENRRRMKDSFELVADWCEFHGFPFLPASAAIFFLIDFSSILDKFGGENATYDEQLNDMVESMLKHGVFMRPRYPDQKPIKGQFRLTFAMPREMALLALKRLEEAFRLKHWTPSAPSSNGGLMATLSKFWT